jgi:proton-dependent oligopeptide transporter, POT family
MSEQPKARVPILEQIRTMKWNFWVANGIEALERLAFFGVRAVVGLYMYGESSALHLSMTEKGMIFGIWALIQCLVPMVSGGYTDTYGYKKSMYVAFAINIVGYCTMANADGFWIMMLAACLVGTGTAIFKPPVQGSVAKSLNEGNSSLGFGIFYLLVNVGGLLAPMAAAMLRGDPLDTPTWHYVFYGAAVVTAFAYIPAAFIFREPELDPKAKDKSPVQVFQETMGTLWRDQPMLRFLLVVSGFWFMFMQLWDLLPNFLDEWVDTRDVGTMASNLLGDGAAPWLMADGALKPEMLINIDSAAIVLLVLPLSWFFGRFKMMTSLVLGMMIATVGFTMAGMSQAGTFAAIMIFVFALGEIICSPKFSEFIGMTAPPDKKAIYMGYSNIPFAIGWAVGNWASGPLYDVFSSRTMLARKWLLEQAGLAESFVGNEDLLPDNLVIEAMAAQMDGASADALQSTVAEVLSRQAEIDAMKQAGELAPENVAELVTQSLEPLQALSPNIDTYQAITTLWDTYDPWIIWPMLGSVGLLSVLGMIWNYVQAQKTAPAVPQGASTETDRALAQKPDTD